jgi:hypothetical protein
VGKRPWPEKVSKTLLGGIHTNRLSLFTALELAFTSDSYELIAITFTNVCDNDKSVAFAQPIKTAN